MQGMTAAQAAEAIFGSGPFITDPCRDGDHGNCRFRGCDCPGHKGTKPGAPCSKKETP